MIEIQIHKGHYTIAGHSRSANEDPDREAIEACAAVTAIAHLLANLAQECGGNIHAWQPGSVEIDFGSPDVALGVILSIINGTFRELSAAYSGRIRVTVS